MRAAFTFTRELSAREIPALLVYKLSFLLEFFRNFKFSSWFSIAIVWKNISRKSDEFHEKSRETTRRNHYFRPVDTRCFSQVRVSALGNEPPRHSALDLSESKLSKAHTECRDEMGSEHDDPTRQTIMKIFCNILLLRWKRRETAEMWHHSRVIMNELLHIIARQTWHFSPLSTSTEEWLGLLSRHRIKTNDFSRRRAEIHSRRYRG